MDMNFICLNRNLFIIINNIIINHYILKVSCGEKINIIAIRIISKWVNSKNI